jgi:hypothetical protein
MERLVNFTKSLIKFLETTSTEVQATLRVLDETKDLMNKIEELVNFFLPFAMSMHRTLSQALAERKAEVVVLGIAATQLYFHLNPTPAPQVAAAGVALDADGDAPDAVTITNISFFPSYLSQ